MQHPCSNYRHHNITTNSPSISQCSCNLAEYSLLHGIAWTDIEHINGTEWIQREVQYSCNQTAAKIEAYAEVESFSGVVCSAIESADTAKDDQQDVPRIGMDCQREMSAVHAAGVKEGEDPA